MSSPLEETRPAAADRLITRSLNYSIANPDRRKAERWKRYFYSLHLAVIEHEKMECRQDVTHPEIIEKLLEPNGENTNKKT